MSRDVGDPSDDWIAEGLEAAIGLDPRVGDEDEIGISVRRGVVTLTGSVDDLMAARAARRVAENTTGVRRVYSYLRVRPREELMDEQLESRVEARLAADPYTQSFNMTAEVYQGVLTLSGNVHSNFERERAEEAAAGVDGIIAIENHLDVREPARHLSDVELAHDVASKLERDAWVATGSVVVSAVAGVVALEGSVTSPNAKRRAIDDAYDAGARRVDAEALVIRF
jgi:osmotically-inducible protein OsmY